MLAAAENLLSNKINFYLVIVTATVGGLILSSDIPEIKREGYKKFVSMKRTLNFPEVRGFYLV